MTYFRKLEGEKCFLSPVSISDSKNWSRWLKITPEEAEAKIKKINKAMDKCFSVIDPETEKSIGIIRFDDINQLYQNCTVSVVNPFEGNWTNGIFSEAIRLALDFAFNCLNMHSVSIWIPENETSKIQCFKAWGFRETARRRQSVKIDGQMLDNIYLDILSTENSSVFIIKHLDEMERYSAGKS